MAPVPDFRTLVTQVISGEISADDRLRFFELIENDDHEAEFNAIMKSLFENKAPENDEDNTAWETMIQSILDNKIKRESINACKIDGDRMVYALPVWRRLKYVAAAAVIAGAFFITKAIFFPKKEANPVAINKSKTTDVLPGGNHARLTLSNDSTIVLDSAQNGILTMQSGMSVIKTDSGSISYISSASHQETVVLNTLTTPRGGQYQLSLPDGTKVWLNAASSVTYPTAFHGKERKVSITGEVYFEVVHRAGMPFVVNVNDQRITDIGTSFNINAYPEEASITTTLITGSVKIFTGSKTNTLIPGQQETASFEGKSVSVKNHVDIEKVIAWRRGHFEFNKTTLPVIMRQISRWYDLDIKYEGQISDENFGGGISRQLPLSDVLRLLEANGVHFRLENKTLFVSQ